MARSTDRKVFENQKNDQPKNCGAKEFKASFGWLRHFINHQKIKFWRRKCRREKTAEDRVVDFE